MCFVLSGAQKFDVIWLHNNKEIKPSKNFEYTNTANVYKLNIAEIFPEDSGTYTCEAFNDAGESFSSCTIVVQGKLCIVIHGVLKYVITECVCVTNRQIENK